MRKISITLLIVSILSVSHIFAQKAPIESDSLEYEFDSLKSVTLGDIVIESKIYKKYNLGNISNSLRIQGQMLEIPQNIQIINSSVLRDQLSLNVTESVTRNVSGAFREELHNGVSPDIYLRGGYISAQRNGVDLRPLLKGPIGDDVAIIENIEFVKGPSGFLNSLGDPAGSYNIITKKPTGTNRKSFQVMQGSFGLLRAEADLDGKFDEDGKLLYRFNIMGMNKKGFLQFDNNERILIAPSLKYKFDESTSLTVEYIYQRLNYMLLSEAQISPYGFGSLPTDFTISDPNLRPYRANDHSAFVNFQKKFNQNWSFTTQVSNINSQSAGTIFWVYGKNETDPDILDRYYVYDGMKYNIFSTQAFTQGNFSTGNIRHSFLAGIDFNHKRNKTQDTWGTATAIYPLSISNPIYSNVINNNGIGGDFDSENGINSVENLTDSRLYYTSAYVMDEIGLIDNKLKISAGLRLTQSDADFNQYGEETEASDWVLTPRLGANYLLTNSFSVYGLYDNSFIPQAGIAYDKTPLKPIRGVSFEAGLKKDWNNKALSTTLSFYHITRSQNIVKDPVSNDFYQSGENESQGIEFDLRGRIVKGLDVIINYAYTDSKITKDDKNPGMVGMATPNRIRHIQNSWLNYELPFKALKDFSLSLGYQYMAGRAERFTSMDPQELKDYFRMDGGISFTKKRFSINLIVNNILDSKQYSTAWKKNDMYYWVQLPPVNYRCSFTVTL
ncbi:TonB-dependent siderophore receptor [Dysgonomonas sp. ZJ279]|uniref:TonB-dependent siderophore receptor n=1 Tax=Dysgonomonas sp. ZJ279 TaxID=2709796 RepID=UPI0013EA87FE|nr:TonB-dependent receptor [Dysgonomonas sp. ZJ279]